jgi:acyl carrier protein
MQSKSVGRDSSEASADVATRTEQRFSRIVTDTLRITSVAPEADFLEIGGHSLTAMRIAARVLEEFGVDLDLEVFFSSGATIRHIAKVIDALQQVGHAPPTD